MARKIAALSIVMIVCSSMAGVLAAQEREGVKPSPPAENPLQKHDDQKKAPEKDEGLTPEEIIERLKEITKLMETSEEFLTYSSQGETLKTQKEIIEKIAKLLKQEGNPPPQSSSDLQKDVMKMLDQLMKKTEKNQKGTLDKIDELIKKAKDSG